jgi:hypothetical protein
MGHIRGHGCRDLLIIAIPGDATSAHMKGDWLADDVPVCSYDYTRGTLEHLPTAMSPTNKS